METIIHQFDLEPGGTWLNEMKWGDNSHFHKVVFQDIPPPGKARLAPQRQRRAVEHNRQSKDARLASNALNYRDVYPLRRKN